MKILQSVLRLFSPSQPSITKKELNVLLNTLIDQLPGEYNDLKEQRQKSIALSLSDWNLFPDFKFIDISYPGDIIFSFKKRNQNYKISGLRIFSKRLSNYTNVELLIRENLVHGIKIEDSKYNRNEFDLKMTESNDIQRTAIEFPPTKTDLFFNSLDDGIKTMLNPDTIAEIDFNNRTYFTLLDLEDGNYIAADRKLNIYSLVHDASPIARKLKLSMKEILEQIRSNRFDKDKHLEERFRGK